MAAKKGNLSINSENIFPIIKKWLYSDHDIFVREMVSNCCDAITKLKKLDAVGEYELPDGYKPQVQVKVSPTDRTVSYTDNGLGMTEDEVDEYINQIAFSGAQSFLEQYKDKASEDQIIGHFGLGFYSAFMVADRVTIDTLSYQKGAVPVHWESDGGNEFTMDDGDKEEVGTCVTLYLNEDSVEFSNYYRMEEVLEKYCGFMPIEIYLSDVDAEPEYDTIDVEDVTDEDTVIETFTKEAVTEEKENEDGTKEMVEVEPAKEQAKILRRPEPVNDTTPLWTKQPKDCTDEEYKEFYRKVFNDYKEPLFWIHLNMDYPFNLKGILYFPKISLEYESADGIIKLYNNQVFIADNIKEVIPEFLMLLKGVIDCPDLPLNVSRSALQNDGYVQKISDYITKKVADKLTGMYKTEKETYEKYWDDINPFIKYGYIRDEKFREKIQDYMIFKDLSGNYLTLPECLDDAKESHENIIYYVTDEREQGQYISMFKSQGMNAVLLPYNIDTAFIQEIEQANENLHFKRIDADSDSYKETLSDDETEAIKADADTLRDLFRKVLGKDEMEVSVEKLKDDNVASMITMSEDSRRMQEMFKMYGMADDPSMFGDEGQTLILNINHPLVKAVLDDPDGDETPVICEQLYDLALLSYGSLSPERMTAFIQRSNDLMMKLTQ